MTPELIKVFNKIKSHELFKKHDFRLIGGTALAYHIQHRISEDLDFAFLGKLPFEDIRKFREEFGAQRISTSEGAYEEFVQAGDDITKYHQDMKLDGVKITFFDNSSNIGAREIFEADKSIVEGGIKISSLDTVFRLKSLMFHKRAKSRDYYDLLFIYKNKELSYSVKDTLKIIQEYERLFQGKGIESFPLLLETAGYNEKADESLVGLTCDISPTFYELKERMLELINSGIQELLEEQNEEEVSKFANVDQGQKLDLK